MQISLNRRDFRAMLLLPRELQRKAIYIWQLAEFAWRRPQAVTVLDHLLCLAHAVRHIVVLAARPGGTVVSAHRVFDPAEADLDDLADWPAVVASSIGWARDSVLTFEFSGDGPGSAYPPLFDFWAYNQTDYRRLHRRAWRAGGWA